MVKDMTEARDAAVITEALTVIDEALAKMLNRELVSTEEVADLCSTFACCLLRTLLPPRKPEASSLRRRIVAA